MTPDVSPAATRVLLALLAVHERDGRATIRTVAREARRALQVTHRRLRDLADEGLVAGVGDGTMGALRPLVRRVA